MHLLLFYNSIVWNLISIKYQIFYSTFKFFFMKLLNVKTKKILPIIRFLNNNWWGIKGKFGSFTCFIMTKIVVRIFKFWNKPI